MILHAYGIETDRQHNNTNEIRRMNQSHLLNAFFENAVRGGVRDLFLSEQMPMIHQSAIPP